MKKCQRAEWLLLLRMGEEERLLTARGGMNLSERTGEVSQHSAKGVCL